MKKVNKLISQHPQITSGSRSEVEVVDAGMEAVTTGTRDVKSNTVISVPSAFEGGAVSGHLADKRGDVCDTERL